jgi:hypothetical protein
MALVPSKPHERFLEQLEELSSRYPRLREIMAGLEWEICRAPDMFTVLTEISDDDHRIGRATLTVPPMYVYFSISGMCVMLISIEEY